MNLNHHHSYQPMLKESINRFFAERRRGVTDFSDFTSIFSRTLHAAPDPPISVLWFYAALEFHSTEPSRTFSAARDLFQLLVSCSSTCGSTKRIAALAPLVFILHRLALRELNSEVEGLVEGVVSYCSIFCRDNDNNRICADDDVAVLEGGEFRDLITVWMVDDDDGGGGGVGGFFPFVSEGLVKGCDVGFLAGVVMCEALLFKLCLAFEDGVNRVELENKLMVKAVQTITGFRSFRFLDTLFRMMLEPVLPVTSVLGSENAVLLKEVLYNSVMMIDYSFINPQAELSLYANSLKDVAITWLFVAELAVQSAREKGDQGKAMSYINAFCRSCIPIQLINWVTNRSCLGGKISRPNVSTPIALIKWLLVVEEQGFSVFGGDTAKQMNFMFKANFFTSRTECLIPVIKHFFNNMDKNIFLNSKNGEAGADKHDGDIEMLDTVDTVNLAAADSLGTVLDGTRKRKDGIEDDTKTQLKFMRCHFHKNSVGENSFVFRQQ